MARRRGFFAEMQHQAKQQAKVQEQRQRIAAREYQAAVRRAEQAQKAAERAHVAATRAAEADRKRAEREAAAAYVAARQAEVEALNISIAEQYDELDSLLSATFDVDDYVDLETFRVLVEHPPFGKEKLRLQIPEPAPIPDPAWPVKAELETPSGLFGRK